MAHLNAYSTPALRNVFLCLGRGKQMARPKLKNEYIILGKTAVVDISTKTHPNSSMKIDLDVWLDLLHRGMGRVSRDYFYARVHFDGMSRLLHKIITPSFKDQVDHINHDRFDNRLSNLRSVTQTENGRNRSMSKANKSGHCGIREYKGVKGSTWLAQIRDGNKQIHLGTFKTLEKAIAVRKAAEIELGFHTLHGAK
jgi:hypothetical protein